jgi:hypothetical protein
MDRHIGTAITDTVTANPGMAASSGPSRFRSGVRTGDYLFEDAHVEKMSTFGIDEHLRAPRLQPRDFCFWQLVIAGR